MNKECRIFYDKHILYHDTGRKRKWTYPQSVLAAACYRNEPRIFRFMLKDQDPNFDRNILLAIAAYHGSINMVDMILKDDKCVISDATTMILGGAVHKGHDQVLKRLLLDTRINLQEYDDIIYDACCFGHINILKVLLEDGRADPGALGNVSLARASENGNLDIVMLLLADCRVQVGERAMYAAVVNGHIHILKLLVQKYTRELDIRFGIRCIKRAIRDGNIEMVQIMMDLINPRLNGLNYDRLFRYARGREDLGMLIRKYKSKSRYQ